MRNALLSFSAVLVMSVAALLSCSSGDDDGGGGAGAASSSTGDDGDGGLYCPQDNCGSCPGGTACCNGQCVDILNGDVNNCGQCCKKCPNQFTTCVAGDCAAE